MKRRFKVALPALLVLLLDICITLSGQPAAYWLDHSFPSEGNPLFAYLLTLGPASFLAGAALWGLMITAGTLWLPGLLSLVWSVAFCLGHAYGSLTWLMYHYLLNFNLIYLYFPLLALLVIWQVRLFYSENNPG